jgi:hypothetical protein
MLHGHWRWLHRDLVRHWTVDDLGREVGLSRSALIGMPPMTYLASWRMQVATQKLRAVAHGPRNSLNGFEPTSPEARAAIETLIKDPMPGSGAWWCRPLVTSTTRSCRRSPTGASSPAIRPIGLKLVDELGDEQQALLGWPRKSTSTPSCQLHDRFRDLPFLHAMAAAALDAAGLGTLARHLDDWGALQAVERLNLDGLLALWHPGS